MFRIIFRFWLNWESHVCVCVARTQIYTKPYMPGPYKIICIFSSMRSNSMKIQSFYRLCVYASLLVCVSAHWRARIDIKNVFFIFFCLSLSLHIWQCSMVFVWEFIVEERKNKKASHKPAYGILYTQKCMPTKVSRLVNSFPYSLLWWWYGFLWFFSSVSVCVCVCILLFFFLLLLLFVHTFLDYFFCVFFGECVCLSVELNWALCVCIFMYKESSKKCKEYRYKWSE